MFNIVSEVSFKKAKIVRVFVYNKGRVLVKVSCWMGEFWQIKTKTKWREISKLDIFRDF